MSRCVWHAHRHGVLHRDVKPANVLLPRSGRPAAKVSDFGIARLADVASATPPGTVTGTPRFASPEARLAALGLWTRFRKPRGGSPNPAGRG